MPRLDLSLAILACCGALAAAQGQKSSGSAKGAAATPPAQKKAPATPTLIARNDIQAIALMNNLLEQWGERSRSYKTIRAEFTLRDFDKDFGTQIFDCVALIQSPNLVSLEKAERAGDGTVRRVNRKAISDRDELFVCDGTSIYQYVGKSRQVLVNELPPEDRNKPLQEGALPFLFNMEPERVKRRYRFFLRQIHENYWFVQIEPRMANDPDEFRLAWIRLNKKTFLPDKLDVTQESITDEKGKLVGIKREQIYEFLNIDTNPKIAADAFKPPAVASGARVPLDRRWEIVRAKEPERKAAQRVPIDNRGAKPKAR